MTKILYTVSILFLPFILFSQAKISGLVKDADTGELLIGATIVEQNTNNGVATNSNGYFSILTKGESINVSYIGYNKIKVNCSRDTTLIILLKPGQQLDEVKIIGERFQKFNTTTLSVAQLKSIPSIGSKPDVLKTLQLMPGIQAQGEGTSLLNVRGGNPGENLYLIDNIPLLYVNHLGGFLSVFNPDMINSMEVYKAGFPAKYGGKLSSVMAITQREGNNKQWKGNLGIGVTDASFAVEGPLINDKASIIITGRKTLIDPLMMLASGISDQGFLVFYGFHDINGKITYRPDTKNSYHLNFYQGDDYLNYFSISNGFGNEKAKLTNAWGNTVFSGRWSRMLTPRLFVNNIVSVTNYRLKIKTKFTSNSQNENTKYKSLYLSRVKDVSFRSDWQYKLAKIYNLDFGLKLTALNHIPNKIEQSDQPLQYYEQIRSYENAAYVSNQISLFNFIDADLGLRAVSFKNNTYSTNVLEPRVNLNIRFLKSQTLNISYQQVNQFAHLLFTSGTILNNEIWVPADENLEPSHSVQYSAGWKGTYAKGMFDSELNVYYKELHNLATYKEGYSNLLGDGGWRNKLETGGTGKSQGIEFLFRKNSGNWTGFIAYTFSETTRQFAGINKGDEYVFDYDRPHSASINISKKLSEKWSASVSWVYQTGLPYTPVIGRQYINDNEGGYKEALIYGERNSERMIDYHRLDLGFTCKKRTKKGRKAEWNFSVYNAYNRHNPTAYYYATEKDDTDTFDRHGNYHHFKLYKVSLFPIIPTASYKVFFD